MRPLSFRCCGVEVHGLTLAGAVAGIVSTVSQTRADSVGRTVHLCNSYTLALARRDAQYAWVLNEGTLNLADGAGPALVARRRSVGDVTVATRPRGTDVVWAVVSAGLDRRLRHYLLGSTPETVRLMSDRLQHRFPGALIVGVESPPFHPLSSNEIVGMAGRIRVAAPDLVWVGLGTPKQDYLAERLRPMVATVLVPVGAAFDFIAGTKRQAPRWAQVASVEWLHRLVSEPRRLWRRYLIGNAVFAAGVVAEEMSTWRSRPSERE